MQSSYSIITSLTAFAEVVVQSICKLDFGSVGMLKKMMPSSET